MTDSIKQYDENFDITVPVALLWINYLRRAMAKAETIAEKYALLRECFTEYLVMNAGHYLFDGVILLTDFILSEFTPFTEGRRPAPENVPWLAEYPLTDMIFSQCLVVPDGHCDLFLSEDKDICELVKQLEEQGLIEPDEAEVEILK